MYYNLWSLFCYTSYFRRGADGSFPYTVHEDVLFVTFGRTAHNGFEANENAGSALCQFSLSAIKTEFTRVQTECYQGRSQKLPYIGQGTSCRVNMNMNKGFNHTFLLLFII